MSQKCSKFPSCLNIPNGISGDVFMHVFVYVNVGRLKFNPKSYLWVQPRDAFLLLNAACEKN